MGFLKAALYLALCLAWAAPAWGVEESPYSVVVPEQAPVFDRAGEVMGQVPGYSAWPLLEHHGQRLLIAWGPGPQDQPRPAWLAAKQATVLAGPVAGHAKRLKRLKQVNLPQSIKRRLLAGRIQRGDTMRKVELAWGIPQRSFMVNYFSDEQHYIYFRPNGQKVLLRFVGGVLNQEPPPSPPVESNQTPR